ncbi:putative dehydrogenase [Caldalkalibacillus uzonensis]|uniref:Dehydrogenase n=1 Tax=Caldalkalibacillus uzonensis TaxID=353224 RepID=A0ABU0CRW0_9BACI|nr:Gfo/Idh/MocA family oxidoreductase [Caldalkalibacillus uzonensis]MDQ0338599.1 putative dehydrogenase [Caldalkalibacillus uzonensis]
MKKVKWGVLSTANIAVTTVIPALQRLKNGEVYAIASSSGKAKEVAESLGIPRHYSSYEALLNDPDIDAVYIPLPNSMHYEWTIKAAEREKHVLCEKPAALTAAQVQKMLDACHKYGVQFMEAYMYRFHPQHEKVRSLINEGTIGDVKLMKASFSFDIGDGKGNIRLNPDLGGGAVYDIGGYCINAIRCILDAEPTQVFAYGEFEQGVDTTAYGLLRFAGGIDALFDCSFRMAKRNEYEVIGTKGIIRVPQAYRPDENGGIGVVEVTVGQEKTVYTLEADQYFNEVEHFSNCVLHGQEPAYTGEDTFNNMKVIDAVYNSMQKQNR